MVEVFQTHIKDVFICKIKKFNDHRGMLCELFNMEKYPEVIKKFFPSQQITYVTNKKLAHRGLHISPYSKLLTCVKGSVYDVVVDNRPDSSTYLQWVGKTLSEENGYQLLVPPDCGHGYLALEEGSTVIYCQGGCFLPSLPEKSINLFDPIVSIDWPLLKNVKSLISEKDIIAPFINHENLIFQKHRKRILIISAKGQVGQTFYRLLGQFDDKYVVLGTYHSDHEPQHFKLDLETVAKDPSSIELVLDACKPHIVIVCGAMTNVNLCESETKMAYLINKDSIAQLGAQVKKRGARMIYFSTNYVFSDPLTPELRSQQKIDMLASKVGLKEDSTPNCVNVYAKSKLASEELFKDDPSCLIIRTSGVYGPDIKKKNFVYQVIGNLLAGNKLTLLTDEIQCPVYSEDLCRATSLLMEKGCSGIYHIVGPEAFNKCSFAKEIAEFFNLNTSLIIPMTSEELKLAAERPKFAALSTEKFRQEFPGFKFHSVSDALKDWRQTQLKCGKIFPEL